MYLCSACFRPILQERAYEKVPLLMTATQLPPPIYIIMQNSRIALSNTCAQDLTLTAVLHLCMAGPLCAKYCKPGLAVLCCFRSRSLCLKMPHSASQTSSLHCSAYLKITRVGYAKVNFPPTCSSARANHGLLLLCTATIYVICCPFGPHLSEYPSRHAYLHRKPNLLQAC